MNIIAGHRGFAGKAPENTLAALRLAAHYQLAWVETDVQLTRDKVAVILHDDTIDRTSNGHGMVRDLTWQQLQKSDFGSWFDERFKGEPMPTLKQWLEGCIQYGINLNLELKLAEGDNSKELVEQVANVLAEVNFPEERLLFSSFSHEALIEAKQQLGNIRRGHLWEAIPENWLEQLQEIDAISVHCDYALLTQAQAKAIKAAGYDLFTYTPNEPNVVDEQWRWGVDMVITDHPERYPDKV